MVVPLKKALDPDEEEPSESCCWVHRWVRQPDGSDELVETVLTPEYFLNPRFGDQMVQGAFHAAVTQMLTDVLQRRFQKQEDVLVFSDVKLLWGIRKLRRRQPVPDVTVVRGVRHRDLAAYRTYNVAKEGVLPCLVVEVVSDSDPRLRRADLVAKVKVYQEAKIPEYLAVDPPSFITRERFDLILYRLDPEGRYQRVVPDEQGRLLSETTGVLFAVTPEGDRILLFDAATGERLLTSTEEEAARRDAEILAKSEAQARQEAEAELARLRAELDRLKKNS